MFIERQLKEVFFECLEKFPAICITGPRQSGKSTFLKKLLPETEYVSFDDPLNRQFATEDGHGFLDQFLGKQVILDEIQYVPELLSYIKLRIDEQRVPGLWVLTGSQSFHLMKNMTESLAGRIMLLELPPLSVGEILSSLSDVSLEELLWIGGFPEPVCDSSKRDLWAHSYVQTYVERDLRQMESIRNLYAFEQFLRLSAAFHSQELNAARFARECGVSQPTIHSWAKLLEASYLALRLPALHQNYGKRVTRSPKWYLSDSLLVSYFTRQPSPGALVTGSMAGSFFEGLIITEAFKVFSALAKPPALYFLRAHSGIEVDLVIEAHGKFWPVEIKLTSSPSPRHMKPIELFKKLGKSDVAAQGTLVCQVQKETALPHGNRAIPWSHFSGWLEELLKTDSSV